MWNTSGIQHFLMRPFTIKTDLRLSLYDSRGRIKPGAAKKVFLVTDNRVFNGPLGRSLCLFTRTNHSAHSLPELHFATLALLARSIHGLAYSLRSLAPI